MEYVDPKVLVREQRIRKLIEILRRPKVRSHLAMSIWYDTSLWCDTVACALGWACQEPEFNAQGLRLESFPNPGTSVVVPTYTGPDGTIAKNYSAGAKFFHITEQQSLDIFSSVSYPTRATSEDVIEKLKKLLRDDQSGG